MGRDFRRAIVSVCLLASCPHAEKRGEEPGYKAMHLVQLCRKYRLVFTISTER